jgi:hypothetical protein
MSLWEEHKFIRAHFIDNSREHICVTFEQEDESVIEHIMPHDETDSDWADLMKETTVDDLHRVTSDYIKEQRKSFESTVMLIAEKEGLIQAKDTKPWVSIVKMIFAGEANEEELFALKLALFEVSKIRGSSNTAVKTQLRKSKTKSTVLGFAFQLVDEANALEAAAELEAAKAEDSSKKPAAKKKV